MLYKISKLTLFSDHSKCIAIYSAVIWNKEYIKTAIFCYIKHFVNRFRQLNRNTSTWPWSLNTLWVYYISIITLQKLQKSKHCIKNDMCTQCQSSLSFALTLCQYLYKHEVLVAQLVARLGWILVSLCSNPRSGTFFLSNLLSWYLLLLTFDLKLFDISSSAILRELSFYLW